MIKKFSFAVAVVAMVSMFGSCSGDQSELNLNALVNSAQVTGKVEYDAGAYKDGSSIKSSNKQAAAGVTVIARVKNSAYVADTKGTQAYTATTDGTGKYTITVDLGIDAADVEVSVLPFYRTKSVVDDGTIVPINNALYNNVKPVELNLNDRDIKTAEFVVTSDAKLD